MALKRKIGRRPYAMKNRKRQRMVRRIPRNIRPNQVALKRTWYQTNWTFGTAATANFWQYYQFELATIPNLVELTGLFDEYKINAIKLTFRPRYDSVDVGDAAAATSLPQAYLHYCVDPANTQTPSGIYNSATLNSFLEHSGTKTRTLNRPVSIYFKPKVISELVSNQSGMMRKPDWIRTSATNVAHRGVHVFLQQNNFATSNNQIVLDVFYTYYMQLKNIR